MWRCRLPALKPKNGRPRRALQVLAEGHIAAHTAARLTQGLLATALDCTPAMDVRRILATGYLTEQAPLHLTASTAAATPHRTDRFSTEGARRAKRLGSPYRSGRSRNWIKSKNPKHSAVKREAEED